MENSALLILNKRLQQARMTRNLRVIFTPLTTLLAIYALCTAPASFTGYCNIREISLLAVLSICIIISSRVWEPNAGQLNYYYNYPDNTIAIIVRIRKKTTFLLSQHYTCLKGETSTIFPLSYHEAKQLQKDAKRKQLPNQTINFPKRAILDYYLNGWWIQVYFHLVSGGSACRLAKILDGRDISAFSPYDNLHATLEEYLAPLARKALSADALKAEIEKLKYDINCDLAGVTGYLLDDIEVTIHTRASRSISDY